MKKIIKYKFSKDEIIEMLMKKLEDKDIVIVENTKKEFLGDYFEGTLVGGILELTELN